MSLAFHVPGIFIFFIIKHVSFLFVYLYDKCILMYSVVNMLNMYLHFKHILVLYCELCWVLRIIIINKTILFFQWSHHLLEDKFIEK